MILDVAAEWGCPPWIILDHEDALEWFWKWAFYTGQKRIREANEWLKT
jgi:hypothetical protein